MIQLRPYQANEVARGQRFEGWNDADAAHARSILAALPLPVETARSRFPPHLLDRLLSEWYIWQRKGQLDLTRGAVRQCYDAWKAGHRRVLLAAVTGDGKTEIGVKISSDCASRGWRCIFVADQQNLVKQSAARFAKYGLRVGVIWAGAVESGLLVDRDAPIQVASLQTLQAADRRGDAYWRAWHGADRTLWIFDEAHDQTAWSELGQSILRNPGMSWYLGLTGSPFRLSPQQGMGDLFDALAWTRCYKDAVAISIPEIVAAYRSHGHALDHCGSILPVRYLGAKTTAAKIDTSGIDRGADGDYNQQQLTRMSVDPALLEAQCREWSSYSFQRTLAFCCTIEHAIACASHFSGHGVPVGVVTGNEKSTGIYRDDAITVSPREEVCARLASGHLRIVFSVAAMIKGVDISELDAALCLRPTESFALFVQMVGRIRRPCPRLGLTSVTWLDMTRNAATFAATLEQMDSFELAKGGAKGTRRVKTEPTGQDCPRCRAILPQSTATCPYCAYVIHTPPPALTQVHLQTYEIDTRSAQPRRISAADKQRIMFRLSLRSAYEKGHHPGWAVHKHTAVTKTQPLDEWFLHALFPRPTEADHTAYMEHLKRHALKRDDARRKLQSDTEFIRHYFRLEFGRSCIINPEFLTRP